MTNISVLIVDDSVVIRGAIAMALSAGPGSGIDVCAEANSAEQLWNALGSGQIDVVTLDIELPDANGLELIELIKARGQCGIVVISGKSDEHEVAMRLGASACFAKSDLLRDPARLAEAIRNAAGHGDRRVA